VMFLLSLLAFRSTRLARSLARSTCRVAAGGSCARATGA
jgi:hypothetical protein